MSVFTKDTVTLKSGGGASKAVLNFDGTTVTLKVDGSTVDSWAVGSAEALPTAQDAITAVGTTQATGYQLTKEVNRVTVGASTTGVNLPASTPGIRTTIINAVANSIHVYPVIGGTETINGIAAGTGVVQQANSVVTYYASVAGTWVAQGIGSGFSGQLVAQSASNALTALGSGQSDALPLVSNLNRVTVGASTTGVNLPASAAGLVIRIINAVANAIHVYPFQGSSDTINGVAAATGVIQMTNSVVDYVCTVAGTWTALGNGIGFSGQNIPTASFTNTITAHSGGTQAAALALTTQINVITVCAADGDSVRLPTSIAGMRVVVANRGAKAAQVYGAGTETVDSIATAVGVALPAGKTAVFNCVAAGNWVSDLPYSGLVVSTAGTTALTETGDGINFTSRLTLTAFAVGTSGDNASLGFGAALCVFPAGAYMVKRVTMNLGITAATSGTTSTPEVGLGTVVGTGAIATLGAGASTMENMFDGTATADVAGTKLLAARLAGLATGIPLTIASGGVHTAYLNLAAAWADVSAAGAVTADGTVTIAWAKVV